MLWRYGDYCPFENVSERKNALHVFNTNDETRNNIPDELVNCRAQEHTLTGNQTLVTTTIEEQCTVKASHKWQLWTTMNGERTITNNVALNRQTSPGWSPRDNQRWTALFQRFDVFQRWVREHEKHQSWSTLIFSESALFRTEKFTTVQIWEIQSVSERISAVQRWFP